MLNKPSKTEVAQWRECISCICCSCGIIIISTIFITDAGGDDTTLFIYTFQTHISASSRVVKNIYWLLLLRESREKSKTLIYFRLTTLKATSIHFYCRMQFAFSFYKSKSFTYIFIAMIEIFSNLWYNVVIYFWISMQ